MSSCELESFFTAGRRVYWPRILDPLLEEDLDMVTHAFVLSKHVSTCHLALAKKAAWDV